MLNWVLFGLVVIAMALSPVCSGAQTPDPFQSVVPNRPVPQKPRSAPAHLFTQEYQKICPELTKFEKNFYDEGDGDLKTCNGLKHKISEAHHIVELCLSCNTSDLVTGTYQNVESALQYNFRERCK